MPGSRWTTPQIESLVDQIVHLSKPLPQIDIPGKTRAAINNQRKRLQRAGVLNGSFAGREVRPWTFPELKRLTAFTAEYGFSASFIAQMGLLPGRTKDSVSKMMGRHGLGNPAIKERARQACRWACAAIGCASSRRAARNSSASCSAKGARSLAS